MLSVELDICSGMPNPTWILSPQEEKSLVDQIMANPKLMKPVSSSAVHLGYKGMIVNLVKEDDGAWTKLRNNTISKSSKMVLPTSFRLFGNQAGNDVEEWLVDQTSEKADSEVDDFLKEFLHNQFTAPDAQELKKISPESPMNAVAGEVNGEGAGMSCQSNYFTGTDFSMWNGTYQSQNNCYNFAANDRSNNFAQPGRRPNPDVINGMNRDKSDYGSASDKTKFLNAVIADGWRNGCATSRNLTVILVIMLKSKGNPVNDFHWYRNVALGTWGHKPGTGTARSYDASGKTITWPESCDRRVWGGSKWYPGYTEVWGYFYQDNNLAYVS